MELAISFLAVLSALDLAVASRQIPEQRTRLGEKTDYSIATTL